MGRLRDYDAKKVSVIIGVQALGGFADGTFVEVDADEDAYTKKVGADGEVTRSKSNNYAGKITVTLDQTSPSNAYLSGLAVADRINGLGVVPVLIKDNNSGTTLFASEAGWVMKVPKAGYGKKSEDRAWVIDCAQLVEFIGGN